MDDFRRRYDVPRRDYGMPPGRPPQPTPDKAPPQPAQPPDVERPPTHQPHQQTPSHQPAPHHPHPQTYQAHQQPAQIDDLRPPTQRYTPPPTHHQAPSHHQPSATSKIIGQNYFKVAVATVIVLVAIVAYLALKPAPKPKQVLPADLAKQTSFNFYAPSSDTSGFGYDPTKSTVSNGQAFFLLNKGTEHVVVREQNWSSSILDSSSITNPAKLETLIGQAAIGSNSSQTAAAVLANHTLINITSNGSVSQAEIIAIINSLKNISPGQ